MIHKYGFAEDRIYKYGFETWSFTLGEEYMLQLFEKQKPLKNIWSKGT
jgi:hypothetical protein